MYYLQSCALSSLSNSRTFFCPQRKTPHSSSLSLHPLLTSPGNINLLLAPTDLLVLDISFHMELYTVSGVWLKPSITPQVSSTLQPVSVPHFLSCRIAFCCMAIMPIYIYSFIWLYCLSCSIQVLPSSLQHAGSSVAVCEIYQFHDQESNRGSPH